VSSFYTNLFLNYFCVVNNRCLNIACLINYYLVLLFFIIIFYVCLNDYDCSLSAVITFYLDS